MWCVYQFQVGSVRGQQHKRQVYYQQISENILHEVEDRQDVGLLISNSTRSDLSVILQVVAEKHDSSFKLAKAAGNQLSVGLWNNEDINKLTLSAV